MSRTVEVFRAHGRTEASIITALLDAHGIEAACLTNDAGGEYPFTVGAMSEVRVLVASEDLERALSVIADAADDPLESDESVEG